MEEFGEIVNRAFEHVDVCDAKWLEEEGGDASGRSELMFLAEHAIMHRKHYSWLDQFGILDCFTKYSHMITYKSYIWWFLVRL